MALTGLLRYADCSATLTTQGACEKGAFSGTVVDAPDHDEY